MKAESHLAVSLAVSIALYALFRSLPVSLWSLVGGTLIDLDHFYDYLRYPHRPSLRAFDPGHFFDVMYQKRLERIFILLHSWEIAVVVLIAGWWFPAAGGWAMPLGFGMSVHLLMDAFSNAVCVTSYSLAARWAHRSDREFFYAEKTRGK